MIARISIILTLAALMRRNVVGEEGFQKTNFILIMYDDLRNELSTYGRTHMITPNFDRLAAKSLVFDKAYCQIAVCNPSRDSMLTGLRPDTVGTYAFQSSFRPHVTLNQHLIYAGYNTAGYGKVSHWEVDDKMQWNFEQWDNRWYEYQMEELKLMNASTQPDKTRAEESFRDYEFATKSIGGLKKLAGDKSKHFMMAVGFKLPHLAVHLPYKYFEMYKNPDRMEAWKLSKKESKFPYSSPPVAYRCCANPKFQYMNEEGTKRAKEVLELGNINMPFTERMHDELMQGYAGSITFLDKQLGRLLDTIDDLQLWNNVTIVLTSDHGMHNGEKGLWEKWSLFDESARVPLMIYHPQSAHKGKHFSSPVELLDIYPTVLDLLQVDKSRASFCGGRGALCRHLQGRSLAPLVLGQPLPLANRMSAQFQNKDSIAVHHDLEENKERVAITQTWRCSHKETEGDAMKIAKVPIDNSNSLGEFFGMPQDKDNTDSSEPKKKPLRYSNWKDCDKNTVMRDTVLSVMGYSMRSNDFRYTSWYYWHKTKAVPKLDSPLFAEELYDVRGEKLEDFTHLELTNVAGRGLYKNVTAALRARLANIIRSEFLFSRPQLDKPRTSKRRTPASKEAIKERLGKYSL